MAQNTDLATLEQLTDQCRKDPSQLSTQELMYEQIRTDKIFSSLFSRAMGLAAGISDGRISTAEAERDRITGLIIREELTNYSGSISREIAKRLGLTQEELGKVYERVYSENGF